MDICKMHFYKYMDGFYMHSICLPEKVKTHFTSLVGKLLALKRPTGNSWYVGLIKDGDKLVLQPGWHDFVSDNGVSQSDLLVFKRINENTFEVLIFDQSGSEKSFRTKTESNCSTQLPDLPTDEENECRESDTMSEPESPALTSSAISRKFKCNKHEASTAMVVGRMTREMRHKAQKLQQQVQAINPSFAVVIDRYHVKRYTITIPSKFSYEHYPKQHQDFVLRLGGSKGTWPAKYAYRPYRQDMSMKEFFRDNNLQCGDICLFEVVNGGKHTMFNVYISRKDYDVDWL